MTTGYDHPQTLGMALAEAMEQLEQVLASFKPQLVAQAQALFDTAWAGYRDAGAPYGESDEGLHRWLREVSEIARLEQRIAEIRLHWETLAVLRRKMEARMNPAAGS